LDIVYIVVDVVERVVTTTTIQRKGAGATGAVVETVEEVAIEVVIEVEIGVAIEVVTEVKIEVGAATGVLAEIVLEKRTKALNPGAVLVAQPLLQSQREEVEVQTEDPENRHERGAATNQESDILQTKANVRRSVVLLTTEGVLRTVIHLRSM